MSVLKSKRLDDVETDPAVSPDTQKPKKKRLSPPHGQPFKATDQPNRDFRGEKVVNGEKIRV